MPNNKRVRGNTDEVSRKRKVDIPRHLTKHEMQKPEMVSAFQRSYHSLAVYLRAREWYEGVGYTFKEIEPLIGVHRGTIQSWAHAGGWDIRPRSNQRRLTHREVNRTVFMYEKLKMSTSEIGDVLNRHPTTIEGRLKRAGVTLRTNKEAMDLFYEKQRTGTDYRQLRVVNG